MGALPPSRGQDRPYDRGSASLELAVVFPAVLILIFGIVQGGLWFHARNIATYAAVEGLRAAQAYGGDVGAGVQRAREVLRDAQADGFIEGVTVSGARAPESTQITVAGTGIPLIPFLPTAAFQQTASGPSEQLRGTP